MDTSNLTTQIQQFLDVLDTDPLIREQLLDHSRRQAKAAALLQIDHLEQMTLEELHDLIEDTDAWYGVRSKEMSWGWAL